MTKLILASQSPFRKELMERLQIPFETMNSKVNEDIFKEQIQEPESLALTLAKQKALSVFKNHKDSVVIGSDQVAHLKGEILSKPGGFDKAFAQLSKLQGKTHELITAVSVVGPKSTTQFVQTTKLKMKYLRDDEIKTYLLKDNPYKSAGSYMIEKAGIALFESIDTTDFTSIIGLPLMELSLALEDFDIFVLGNNEDTHPTAH